MKRFFLSLLCAVCLSSAAYAVGDNVSIGVSLANGSCANNMGLGVKLQSQMFDAFRLEPAFNYFFKHNNTTTWDISLNVHYLLNVTNKFDVYPLVGIGYSHWMFDLGSDTSMNKDRLAVNIGVGGEIGISRHVALTGELRYQLMKDYGQIVPAVGLKYIF